METRTVAPAKLVWCLAVCCGVLATNCAAQIPDSPGAVVTQSAVTQSSVTQSSEGEASAIASPRDGGLTTVAQDSTPQTQSTPQPSTPPQSVEPPSQPQQGQSQSQSTGQKPVGTA